MKSASIPNWLAVGISVAFVIGLIFVGMRLAGGEGPRDPSTYPKEAFKPPAYTPPPGTYTKDGKPVESPR